MTKQKSPPKQAILIVNAASRRGADAFEEARDKLVKAGVELIDARAVKEADRLADEIESAVRRAPMVILGGGDGTLSKAVDQFVGKDVVFAFLPLGTANSFARTLGVPLELDGAIEVIAKGAVRRIDVGRVGKDYYLNNAAIGLATEVAQSVPGGLKRALGRLGYLIWAGWSAASFNAFRLVVHEGGRRHRLWATEVRIANGRFHGGLELIEDADLDSGQIIVQAVEGRSVAKLGWNYLTNALKTPNREDSVREFRAREMRIETSPKMRVSIDGEVGPETPFAVGVAPEALLVAAPRETSRPG